MRLVSIIIPCYNAAEYLAAAIDSVLMQSYPNLELILINDGSTDDTANVVKNYNDHRIRYFFQENKGQSAASNKGIEAAQGAYIKFFDADDILHPQHIEMQVKVLQGAENAIACCNWGRFYKDDLSSLRYNDYANQKDMLPLDWLKATLRERYDMMPAWLWLIPKKIIDKVGGWDERLSLNNDFEFSIRLLLQCSEIKFAGGALLYYRSQNIRSLSSLQSAAAYESAYLSAQLGCAYLLAAENSAEMRVLCANKYLFWIYLLYPSYPSLVKKMEVEVRALGGGDRKIGGLSRWMHFLQATLGWKTAKRIKLFFYRLGFERWGTPLKKKLTGWT